MDPNTNQEPANCGCGRSPTGKCIGWHTLTEEQWKKTQEEWQIQEELAKTTKKIV